MQEKAPAAKAGQWLQKAEERSGLRTLDKLQRAVREWSKGLGAGADEGSGATRPFYAVAWLVFCFN